MATKPASSCASSVVCDGRRRAAARRAVNNDRTLASVRQAHGIAVASAFRVWEFSSAVWTARTVASEARGVGVGREPVPWVSVGTLIECMAHRRRLCYGLPGLSGERFLVMGALPDYDEPDATDGGYQSGGLAISSRHRADGSD